MAHRRTTRSWFAPLPAQPGVVQASAWGLRGPIGPALPVLVYQRRRRKGKRAQARAVNRQRLPITKKHADGAYFKVYPGLPVVPVETEYPFFIEIVGQDVASRITCDLKQFLGPDPADVARTASADVPERECGLVANGGLRMGEQRAGNAICPNCAVRYVPRYLDAASLPRGQSRTGRIEPSRSHRRRS